jgi:hypothetical protein
MDWATRKLSDSSSAGKGPACMASRPRAAHKPRPPALDLDPLLLALPATVMVPDRERTQPPNPETATAMAPAPTSPALLPQAAAMALDRDRTRAVHPWEMEMALDREGMMVREQATDMGLGRIPPARRFQRMRRAAQPNLPPQAMDLGRMSPARPPRAAVMVLDPALNQAAPARPRLDRAVRKGRAAGNSHRPLWFVNKKELQVVSLQLLLRITVCVTEGS